MKEEIILQKCNECEYMKEHQKQDELGIDYDLDFHCRQCKNYNRFPICLDCPHSSVYHNNQVYCEIEQRWRKEKKRRCKYIRKQKCIGCRYLIKIEKSRDRHQIGQCSLDGHYCSKRGYCKRGKKVLK